MSPFRKKTIKILLPRARASRQCIFSVTFVNQFVEKDSTTSVTSNPNHVVNERERNPLLPPLDG